MSDNYNEILKEKKVYEDPVVSHEHKFFKLSIFVAILISLIIIGISYLVYYNTILDSESIFLNNIQKLTSKYEIFYNNIKPNYNLSRNYTLEGNISIDNINYTYSFIKDNNKIKRTFQNNNNSIMYYYDSDLSYIKLSSLGDTYIEKDNNLYTIEEYKNNLNSIKDNFYNYIYDSIFNTSPYNIYNKLYNIDNHNKVINNIKTNFNTNISSNKYLKKFYLENKEPIVEINLSLTTPDINSILENNNLKVKDDYNIVITMKNNAIDNSIKSIKVVVNNKTKDTRSVVTYQSDSIEFVDVDGNTTKYTLIKNSNVNYIKVYKNDILYSVLSLKIENNTNTYEYHIIDNIYNVKLTLDYNKNEYNYKLETNIDNNLKNIEVSGTYKGEGALSEDIKNTINYNDLSINDQTILDKSIKNHLFGN